MSSQRYQAKRYRCIHPDLRDAVKDVASSLCVPADEIARAFFEAALHAVGEGELHLESRPYARRMTLFPSEGKPGWEYSRNPFAYPITEPAPSLPRVEKKLWQETAVYRISEDTHRMLILLAAEYKVGVGNLASYFLTWGLKKYEEGELRFAPQALTIKQTLILEGVW